MVPISIQWLVPLAFGVDMALSGVKYCVIGLPFKEQSWGSLFHFGL
jgi:hypothetical protein